MDLRRHYVCIFPVFVAVTGSCTGRSHCPSHCCAVGLTPLAAAMAMNLFGHGFALSYDAVIQGAPAISAGAADISTADILSKGRPLFWIMGITCVCSAFLLNRVTMTGMRKTEENTEKNNEGNLNLKWNQNQQLETAGESEKAEEVEKGAKSGKKTYSRTA